MARPDHFGDSAGNFNKINRELWAELGMQVPLEALHEIRRIRSKRSGRQGNSEVKAETKILLAIRQGVPWEHASSREIEYITPRWRGGADELSNMKLSEHIR